MVQTAKCKNGVESDPAALETWETVTQKVNYKLDTVVHAITSALEAKDGGSRFRDSVDYIARPCLKNKSIKFQHKIIVCPSNSSPKYTQKKWKQGLQY